jgi:hypothetical protein
VHSPCEFLLCVNRVWVSDVCLLWKVKSDENPLLMQSLVDPVVTSRAPRLKVTAAPPDTAPPCRGPSSPRGQAGGPQTSRQKLLALQPPRKTAFPPHFPGNLCTRTFVPT